MTQAANLTKPKSANYNWGDSYRNVGSWNAVLAGVGIFSIPLAVNMAIERPTLGMIVLATISILITIALMISSATNYIIANVKELGE